MKILKWIRSLLWKDLMECPNDPAFLKLLEKPLSCCDVGEWKYATIISVYVQHFGWTDSYYARIKIFPPDREFSIRLIEPISPNGSMLIMKWIKSYPSNKKIDLKITLMDKLGNSIETYSLDDCQILESDFDNPSFIDCLISHRAWYL